MSGLDAIMLMNILGQDMRFWITVVVASGVKWFFTSDDMTARQGVAGVISGAMAAYYGHEWVIRYFDSLTIDDKDIVVIGLVISGEHIMRALMVYLPDMVNKRLGINKDEKDEDQNRKRGEDDYSHHEYDTHRHYEDRLRNKRYDREDREDRGGRYEPEDEEIGDEKNE